MILWLREARITYGKALLIPLLAGIATAPWLFAEPEKFVEHAALLLGAVELAAPPLFAMLAVRLIVRDASIGSIEFVGVRGRGYAGRAARRLVILWLVAALALAVPAAAVDSALAVNPLLPFLVWLPGTLLLAGTGALIASTLRSELAGFALAATWWIVNGLFLRDMPTRLPGAILNLFVFQRSDGDWLVTKFAQAALATALTATLVALAPRLARRALVRTTF